jgi:FkbM family methyltransferase
MRYIDRADLQRISLAGAGSYSLGDNNIALRILGSSWLSVKDLDDQFVPHLKRDGYWEAWISLWISQNVAPGSVCIDGGANYGYYTFQLLLHGCKVFAIEANPHLIPYLETSLKLNGDLPLTIMNVALTDGSTETVTLTVTESSLHSTIIINREAKDTVEVKTVRLLDFANKKVDFIKLDIEGAEDQALPDLIKLQKKNPNLLCLMEWVYDAYPNKSRELFDYIIENFNIAYVDYYGGEIPVTSYDFIKKETLDLRMYVLRKK